MPTENPERPMSGVEGLANLAGAQAITESQQEKRPDDSLPETNVNRSEEEKNADVVPEDFDSFNLDAVDKLKDSLNDKPETV